MKKDRLKIGGVLRELLDNPGDGSHNIIRASEALERLVHSERCEALGWAHAESCAALDAGRDPRKEDCADILRKALRELEGEYDVG